MNIEDKLPKAEDVMKELGPAPEDFISSSAYEGTIETMHEYARRLLDVVAESAGKWGYLDKEEMFKFKEMLK